MKGKNAGTTMVEVIVAVMIVSIVMAMFGKVVGASVRMYSRSIAIIRENENFNENYYKTDSINTREEVSGNMTLKEKGSGVTITLPKGSVKKYTDSASGIVRYSIQTEKETEPGPVGD